MGTQDTRRKKIEWLKDAISSFFRKKEGGAISKSKLIAEFALANSSTQRTGEELIEMLRQTGFIKVYLDEIKK